MSNQVFDSIIKKVSSSKHPIDEDNERLVIFDTQNGQIAYEKDIWGGLLELAGASKYEYYVVNYSNFVKIEDLECELHDLMSATSIKLGVTFLLGCPKARVFKAVSFYRKSNNFYTTLQTTITNWAKEFADQRGSLTRDFFQIENELRSYIKQAGERRGLDIQVIRIDLHDSGNSNFPPSHISLTHSSPCEIADSKIDVKNKIVLNLVNPRAFSWNDVVDPEQWIKRKVDEVIQNELIDKSYKDIIADFDKRLSKEIRGKLEAEVRKIGYSVQHIIAVPSEELQQFFEGFSFRTDIDDLNDGQKRDSFDLKEIGVPAKLSVTIEAKGNADKKPKEKYIKPSFSIVGAVKKTSIELISRKMRTLPPEEFYVGDIDKFELELTSSFVDEFQEEFGIEKGDLSVSISRLETPLIKRYNMLCAEEGNVGIESEFGAIKYIIYYRIVGVKDWARFKQNQIKYGAENLTAVDEYQDVSKKIKSQIELELNKMSEKDLTNYGLRLLEDVFKHLFEKAQSLVTYEFGLELGSPNLERVTAVTGPAGSGGRKDEGLRSRLEALHDEYNQAITAGDYETANELDSEIEELEAKRNTNREDAIKKLQHDENFGKMLKGNRQSKIEGETEV